MKMKQISQSQFISISDTLCDIVNGLNESQIPATFDSVVSRLCSSFDSVVIPPRSAIKKSLDLLVNESRLHFLNGLYYFKKPAPLKLAEIKKESSLPHTPPKTEIQGSNRNAHWSKKKVTEKESYHQRETANKSTKLREGIKPKRWENTVNVDIERRPEVPNFKERETSFAEGKKNKKVKSSSLKVRKVKHCIPRRQFSYEELHSYDHEKQTDVEDKKQIKKRNSFIGKLSRFFKMDDEKLTSNDERVSDAEICNGEWEKVVTGDQVKLLSSKVEMKQNQTFNQKRRKGTKRNQPARLQTTNAPSAANIDGTRHAVRRKKKTAEHSKCSRLRYKNQSATWSSKSSTNASSHSRSPDWTTKNFIRSDKRISYQKAEQNYSQSRQERKRNSLSSYSESSCCSLNDSDYSFSSESSIELTRKSFHYSGEDTTDVESLKGHREDNAASNFCSTQAICGDLEVSTLSLGPTLSNTSSIKSEKHIEKHSVIPGANKTETLDQNIQQSNLRSRNLVQLIGVL